MALASSLQPWHGNQQLVASRSGAASSRFAEGWSNVVGFSRRLKQGASCRICHKEQQLSTGLEWDNEAFKDEISRALQEKIAALENRDIDPSKVAALAVEEIMLRGAKLREAIDKTTKLDVDLIMEKSIKEAADEAATSLMSEFKGITEDANRAVQVAKERALKAEEALAQKLQVLDGLYKPEAGSLTLEKSIEALEKELEVTKAELQRLRVDAVAARARAEAAESRAKQAEVEVAEIKGRRENEAAERAENFRTAIESLRSSAAARESAIKEAFQAQLAALQAAVEASETAKSVKEAANLRRFQAFERSLTVAEASITAWKERALNTELLLQQASGDGESGPGGRMANLLSGETYDRFLESGPRQEIPEWMKKRIQASLPGIPPRRYFVPDTEEELVLPDLSDVWSVARAKVKPDDLYSKEAVAKDALQKQRRDLEQAFETTIKRKKLSTERQEPGTGSGREIVFQGFNWESCRKHWYLDLAPKAADLSQSGITAVWLPPPTQSVSPQGYMPVDLYNLNSAYGTLEELKYCIQEMHKHDLLVLGDVVLNHRCAHSQNSNGVWNVFGGKLAWGPEAIVGDDPNFQGQGNPSSGDIFHAAPNIDHSQVFVRNDIKEYLLWLKREIGFDGWRLDFVRGFWGGHVKEYIESSEPAFAIGEYWDSLEYEGGNVSYNQDAHRQRIIDWINATGGTSSAFDVTTKGILHAALHNEYWRLIDPQQKPPGVMGWWPSRAVTFLENHDTGSTQGHWPFPRDKLMQGYAYILTHPGTPAVFYDHFYDFGLREPISELIAARKRVGIHCRSPVKIMHAVSEGYVAKVGENLVVKLGYLDWNPSKQNDLIGNWDKSIDHGTDYQVWEKR